MEPIPQEPHQAERSFRRLFDQTQHARNSKIEIFTLPLADYFFDRLLQNPPPSETLQPPSSFPTMLAKQGLALLLLSALAGALLFEETKLIKVDQPKRKRKRKTLG